MPSDYSKAATEGSLGTRGGSIEETYEVDKWQKTWQCPKVPPVQSLVVPENRPPSTYGWRVLIVADRLIMHDDGDDEDGGY